MQLSDLPFDVLDYDQRTRLEKLGLTTADAVATAPDPVLRDAVGSGFAEVRAAASYALVPDLDVDLLPRLLQAVPGGLGAFVQTPVKDVVGSLNLDVHPDDHVDADTVLALQEGAAVALLRLALAQLLQRGWTLQLAALTPPDDDDADALVSLLEACGGFAKARPYLARIDDLFTGFGGWSGAGRRVRDVIADVSQRPDEMERRRRELSTEVRAAERGWPPGVGVESVIGMPRDAVARLMDVGYRTVLQLRSAVPRDLARRTGFPEERIETWRRQADLQARPGISPSTAYACVAFDAAKSPKRSVYEYVSALGAGVEYLPDRTEAALYRFADGLYEKGEVPEDPFPFREGLQRDQQSLLALRNLHTEVRTRNVLLDPLSNEAEAIGRACERRFLTDVASNERLFTPVNPLFLAFSPWPYPSSRDEVLSAARTGGASYVVRLRVGGATGRVAFPSGLAFDVVPAEDLEADETLQRHYLPRPGHATYEYPRYWLRVTDPESLWEDVSPHFRLRDLVSDSEFLPHVARFATAADARRSPEWADFAATFPIYLPVALVHTAVLLQRLRDAVAQPLRTSSGFRSATNQHSRAGSGSRHIWGTAVDVDRLGPHIIDCAGSTEHPPNRLAWLAGYLLPPRYAGWTAHHQLNPLPDRQPADLDHAVYVEDCDFIRTEGGSVWHLHFDWGYPTPDQERDLLVRYAEDAPGNAAAIEVTTPPARPDDWQAETGSTSLAETLRNHLRGAFGPRTVVNADVPEPRVEADPISTALLRAGFPVVTITLSAAVARSLTTDLDKQGAFGRALVGGLLEMDRSHLAVVRGRVLWTMGDPKAAKPLAGARVGLALGPATDMSTSAAFGGELGTEYQLYNETVTDDEGRYALYLVAPLRGNAAESKAVRIYAGGIDFNRRVIEYDPTTKEIQEAPDIVLTRVVMTPALRGCLGRTVAFVALVLATLVVLLG